MFLTNVFFFEATVCSYVVFFKKLSRSHAKEEDIIFIYLSRLVIHYFHSYTLFTLCADNHILELSIGPRCFNKFWQKYSKTHFPHSYRMEGNSSAK